MGLYFNGKYYQMYIGDSMVNVPALLPIELPSVNDADYHPWVSPVTGTFKVTLNGRYSANSNRRMIGIFKADLVKGKSYNYRIPPKENQYTMFQVGTEYVRITNTGDSVDKEHIYVEPYYCYFSSGDEDLPAIVIEPWEDFDYPNKDDKIITLLPHERTDNKYKPWIAPRSGRALVTVAGWGTESKKGEVCSKEFTLKKGAVYGTFITPSTGTYSTYYNTFVPWGDWSNKLQALSEGGTASQTTATSRANTNVGGSYIKIEYL